jgi:hypothetical protein
MTLLEFAAAAMRLVGLVCIVPGLFLAANGVRVVVSGRVDERQSSTRALKFGLPLLAAGLLLVFGGTWLTNMAHP